MQRSASASWLHVPKRAVQHGCYLPSHEVPPVDLKPGQRSLQRQVYAEEAKPLSETYLQPDRPADSVYAVGHSKLLGPSAYKDPAQKIVQKEPPGGYGHHQVAHWKSTSHSFHNHGAVAGAVYHRQNGPSYQAANPPTCVSQLLPISTCADYHGRHGDNPRDRVCPVTGQLLLHRNTLTTGTHKGTMHIPGYSGHLPHNTSNPHAARVAHGASLRSVDKTNLTAQFHVNLLGYSGHVPLNARNDKGGVKPNTETMFGRSFSAPMLNAFD
mmetsp:Transcript_61889/g.178129  ORF Transcript_61889/g.178129 Transcript_61889/m.178129 type:complete len:269 (+) Transcript_61889:74-880(+)